MIEEPSPGAWLGLVTRLLPQNREIAARRTWQQRQRRQIANARPAAAPVSKNNVADIGSGFGKTDPVEAVLIETGVDLVQVAKPIRMILHVDADDDLPPRGRKGFGEFSDADQATVCRIA